MSERDLTKLREQYLYHYGDTHPVCALVDRVQAAEAALAACEADTARLDWLEANCDMILNHEQLTQDEYRSPAVICCLPEDRPLRESIDAWLAPRP